ncbi:sugar phosphate isomerase/epimerase [bacterium]|nr:sugar phosphate isomerase/epimerase [bacterium]
MNNSFGFNVYDRRPEEFLDYAAEHGLTHIEMNLSKDHSSITRFDTKRIDGLNSFCREHDIQLSMHLPYAINIADIISYIQKNNISYLHQCILLAQDLNVSHITAHIGNFYWFPVERWTRRKAIQRFIRNMSRVMESCHKHNVVIALENVVPIPHGSEFYLLGDNIGDLDLIFSEINSECLKFCLDTGHANVGEGVLPYVEQFQDRLISVHYHDNNTINDEHLPVGEGTVPWPDLITALGKIAYKGPFISEIRGLEPHEAAIGLKSYFEK